MIEEIEEPGINYGTFVAIAADSLQALRSRDVYRVLDETPAEHRPGLVRWILGQRPELADAVSEALGDL